MKKQKEEEYWMVLEDDETLAFMDKSKEKIMEAVLECYEEDSNIDHLKFYKTKLQKFKFTPKKIQEAKLEIED